MSHTAITIYGVLAVTFMMVMYALESRHRGFILGFAIGCLLSSSYGFLAGTWPFGVVEAVWSLIALRRYLQTSRPLPE
jgi:hypothetical protein